jgi:spore coat polysaccharide biosynthesis protein SpsF
MLERVLRAGLAGTVVVATTQEPVDQDIVTLCENNSIPCYQGHPTDLLDRHYQAAQHYQADVVVKIPSDCPLIDPVVIDRVIGTYLSQSIEPDFVSNLHPPTYPDGNDVEVMSFSALQTAHLEASQDFEREHTTPFLWERPERFQTLNIPWETGLDYSMSHRWTIDYEEDYHFIQRVYQELYPSNPAFGIQDILDLLNLEPCIAEINQRFVGLNWYRHHLDQLSTIGPDQTRIMEEV